MNGAGQLLWCILNIFSIKSSPNVFQVGGSFPRAQKKRALQPQEPEEQSWFWLHQPWILYCVCHWPGGLIHFFQNYFWMILFFKFPLKLVQLSLRSETIPKVLSLATHRSPSPNPVSPFTLIHIPCFYSSTTFLDGEGQGSQECCSPWGHKESDRTQQLNNNRFLNI